MTLGFPYIVWSQDSANVRLTVFSVRGFFAVLVMFGPCADNLFNFIFPLRQSTSRHMTRWLLILSTLYLVISSRNI